MSRQAGVGLMACVVWMLGGGPVHSQPTVLDSSAVLYHYDGKLLRDSKWGALPAWQRGLSEALQACGHEAIAADGLYGRGTHRALLRVLACPGFEALAVAEGHPLHGTVHTALWRRVLPQAPPPSVHARAFALALTHEGTDYDRVEWNYGTADDRSALTWGPYGATVGWGNEVQAILQRIHARHPDLLPELFGDEFPTVEALMRGDRSEGYALLEPVYADPVRRQVWKERLQALGRREEGRTAYDAFAFESDQWLVPNLRRLYSLVPDTAATEVDYAFFFDLGMHAGISSSRVRAARERLAAEAETRGRALTPAERRRFIGLTWADAINQTWRADRLGRNVVFYIDGIPRDDLTDEEIGAWARRSGRRASTFGLSDARTYRPAFLEE